MRYKITPNFYLDEFINPETYNRFKERSTRYIRQELVIAVQLFRDIVGKGVTVNDWYNGGGYQESGLRDFETGTGATYSMHKFGAAADLKVSKMTSYEMAEVVKENWLDFRAAGVRRIENPAYTKGAYRDWLHLDLGDTYEVNNGMLELRNDLIIVKP